ncbi:MAG TPA: hypothetical protein DET40_25210 [Lentisphaeria bacterium]|nr:MAG: hypothetical protein A2X45_18755 [Lentisphaerae bacterium GWF2_50_93]HCE46860.1 hypothetical protein [Lentisphaeria bacterium]
MNSAKKYEFRNLRNSPDKIMICPKCLEMLFRDDIEHFSSCPYCNAHIEISQEVEDFLLKPFIDNWVANQSRSNFDIMPPEN